MQPDRKAAAEQLFAQARVQQEMRAAELARRKAARRRWLMIGVPLGAVLGWFAAKAFGQPTAVGVPVGAVLGAVAAFVAGQRT